MYRNYYVSLLKILYGNTHILIFLEIFSQLTHQAHRRKLGRCGSQNRKLLRRIQVPSFSVEPNLLEQKFIAIGLNSMLDCAMSMHNQYPKSANHFSQYGSAYP
jgi:hypothetical protein